MVAYFHLQDGIKFEKEGKLRRRKRTKNDGETQLHKNHTVTIFIMNLFQFKDSTFISLVFLLFSHSNDMTN